MLFAVGDMAGPPQSNPGSSITAELLKRLIGQEPSAVVLVLGDNAYNDGKAGEYEQHYQPLWGDPLIKARAWACPGNHDYHTAGATPYYMRFGERAGPADRRGYYSLDLDRWHLVSLNTERDYESGSHQLQWLEDDLQQHAAQPILAFFHRPRFGSGGHGDSDNPEAFWDVLFRHRAEIVLNGHAHHYERFAPQTPRRDPDAAGIREFIVGTGGRELVPPKGPGRRKPNSETANGDSFGILKLVLEPNGYEWEFIPAIDGGFTDRSVDVHPVNH